MTQRHRDTEKTELGFSSGSLCLCVIGTLASLTWCQSPEQAGRAFDAGDYPAAIKLFEKAREESPRCDILLYLGLARYRLKQVDQALIAFQEAENEAAAASFVTSPI